MIEPLSITTTSFSLLAICAKLSSLFYNVYDQITNADTTLQVLAIEITSLSGVLSSINSTFSSRSITTSNCNSQQTSDETQHWENVRETLKECKKPLEELSEAFRKIQNNTNGGFWRKTKKAVKLNLKADRIGLLKQQLAAYRQSMNMSLQCITLYVLFPAEFY